MTTSDRADGILAAWQHELPDALHPTSEPAKRLMVLADPGPGHSAGAAGGRSDRSRVRRDRRAAPLGSAVPAEAVGLEPQSAAVLRRHEQCRQPAGTAWIRGPRADPDDGRGTQIRLTAEGVAIAEEAVIASAAAQHKLWDGLPDETVQRATAALRPSPLACGAGCMTLRRT